MAKRRAKPTHKFKSFSDMHGSRSDVFKRVTPEQLGHDRQIDVNPNPGGQSSPLINPGQAGHPIRPEALGQSMNYPMGMGDEET